MATSEFAGDLCDLGRSASRQLDQGAATAPAKISAPAASRIRLRRMSRRRRRTRGVSRPSAGGPGDEVAARRETLGLVLGQASARTGSSAS